MAEERTLGTARASEDPAEELSKEELQRRLGQARNSISHTVTEIKETVANQVQAVKETLNWREQFKKRPVAWTAGAAGVGFVVGYGLAAVVKGEGTDSGDSGGHYVGEPRSYAAQPILNDVSAAGAKPPVNSGREQENGHDSGPGLFQKLSHTPAYGRVRDEVGNLGDAFVQELSKTAKTVILPALINSIGNFIGGHLPASSTSQSSRSATMKTEADRTGSATSYQPALERNQS
jgi:ElaB/YqjD/DUF883 family membrane-anchored ribosome-binding protein